VCSIDLEPCEVWNERERTARKVHRCGSCGGAIRKGARYLCTFYVFEGTARAEKSCATCARVADRFADEHGTKPTPESLRPMLDECIANEDEPLRWLPWLRDLKRMDKRRARGIALLNADIATEGI
jgi:hypothetical protein